MSRSFFHAAFAGAIVTIAAGATAATSPGIHASATQASEPESETEKATRAAAAWLALVDEGKYEESWKQASESFRANMIRFGKGVGFWERALETSRKPLGEILGRRVTRAGQTESMPGLPAPVATKFIEIVYHSEFENDPDATEILVVALDEDGVWRAFNYVIRRGAQSLPGQREYP